MSSAPLTESVLITLRVMIANKNSTVVDAPIPGSVSKRLSVCSYRRQTVEDAAFCERLAPVNHALASVATVLWQSLVQSRVEIGNSLGRAEVSFIYPQVFELSVNRRGRAQLARSAQVTQRFFVSAPAV